MRVELSWGARSNMLLGLVVELLRATRGSVAVLHMLRGVRLVRRGSSQGTGGGCGTVILVALLLVLLGMLIVSIVLLLLLLLVVMSVLSVGIDVVPLSILSLVLLWLVGAILLVGLLE